MIERIDDGIRNGLRKKPCILFMGIVLLISVACFYYTAQVQKYALIDDFTGFHQTEYIKITAFVYTCVFAVTCLFQLKELKRLNSVYTLIAMLITALIILGKISLLDYQSDDYEIFLSGWIYEYSELPLWSTFGTYIQSDYSPPYLYFLSFISRIKGFPWLYLLKAISVVFDGFLGFAIMKLVSLKYDSAWTRLSAFYIASLLPTVVFNGAYWSQCDSLYSSLSIMAIYLALRKKDIPSMLLFGCALSFKFQTVFFLPVLLPLWLRKDIQLKWLILIPAGYFVMMVPALLAGKSMHHVLTVYLQQAGKYNNMAMNGPSLYEFMPLNSDSLYVNFSGMAFFITFGFVLCICFLLCYYKDRIDQDAVLLSAVLFLAGVPLFLPKMHERYAFGADVLSLAVCYYRPKRRFLLPVFFGLSSYILYTAGLPGDPILAQKWATLFTIAGVILTLSELLCKFNREKPLDLIA